MDTPINNPALLAENAEALEAEQIGIVRSEPWFDDGNVILQVEKTQFRVHRGVLGIHSPVFKEMFSYVHPPVHRMIDGCPVVHLHDDKADEVACVLQCIYDVK